MWLSEGKLKVKIAHFRLPSASQKRACLSSLISCTGADVIQRDLGGAELDKVRQVTLMKSKGNQKQFEHNALIDLIFDRYNFCECSRKNKDVTNYYLIVEAPT